jgi:4-hydroxybenzoate polyprenyltransferase
LRFLLRMLRIRRIEFFVAEIPILALPILVTARHLAALLEAPIGEGILVFFLLFNFGDMVNCLADRDLDAVYKRRLSEAVYGLGVRFVMVQVALTAIAALALTIHLCFRLDRWLLLPLVAIGLLLGAAYSLEPLRFKRRGVAGLACLWLIIFVGPMIFISMLLAAYPSPTVLVFAAAYATLQMGVILVNTAEDCEEDREAGVRTTIVALGLARGIGVAYAMALLGGFGVLATLTVLFWLRHVPWLGFIALLVTMSVLAFVAVSLNRLWRTVSKAAPAESVRSVKKAAKWVPLWVTLGAWSTCASALVLFCAGR